MTRASNCAPNTSNDAREKFFSSPPRDLHDSLRTWIGRLGGVSSRLAWPFPFSSLPTRDAAAIPIIAAAEMLNLKTLLELVARSRAETAIADALTPRGVGATASRTLLGTPEALWGRLAVRIDQARLVTCQGVAKRVATTQKVLAITRTQGPINPEALQDWIFAILIGLRIRYGNRLEAVVLHRDGPRPVIVAVLVPTDPALRARREFEPGFREPANRTAKSVPPASTDVPKASAPREPAKADPVAIMLPRKPAHLLEDCHASDEPPTFMHEAVSVADPKPFRPVFAGSKRTAVQPAPKSVGSAHDQSSIWKALQDARSSAPAGSKTCPQIVSEGHGSSVEIAPVEGMTVPRVRLDEDPTSHGVAGFWVSPAEEDVDDPHLERPRGAVKEGEDHLRGGLQGAVRHVVEAKLGTRVSKDPSPVDDQAAEISAMLAATRAMSSNDISSKRLQHARVSASGCRSKARRRHIQRTCRDRGSGALNRPKKFGHTLPTITGQFEAVRTKFYYDTGKMVDYQTDSDGYEGLGSSV